MDRFNELKELIKSRRSVRTFDGYALPKEETKKLLEIGNAAINPYDIPVTFRILSKDKHGLRSVVVTGAEDYAAARVKNVPHFEEAVGYSFESFVLGAWEMGIGTTLIAGTMDREAFEKAIDLVGSEVMPLMTPVGHPAKRMSLKEIAMRKGVGADKRKPFGELFFDGEYGKALTEEAAGELADILELVRWAPSAMNKQPWRLIVDGNKVHFYVKHDKGYVNESSGDLQKIDVGIAMCHFAKGAQAKGIDVAFELKEPQFDYPDNAEYIATYVIK